MGQKVDGRHYLKVAEDQTIKQRDGTLGSRLFSEQAWDLIIHFFNAFHENSEGLAILRAIADTTIDQPIKEGRLAVNWMWDALEENLGQTAFGVFSPPDEIHIASNFDKTGWTLQNSHASTEDTNLSHLQDTPTQVDTFRG